jgi:hypothetical protein
MMHPRILKPSVCITFEVWCGGSGRFDLNLAQQSMKLFVFFFWRKHFSVIMPPQSMEVSWMSNPWFSHSWHLELFDDY